jgi:hypothetical protein
LTYSHRALPRSSCFKWAAAGLAPLALAACGAWQSQVSIPATLRTPTLVGVVERADALSESHPPIIHLIGGRDYDPSTSKAIIQRGNLGAGSLLLAGTEPDTWYGFLLENPPGCYYLDTRGRDDGATVVTEVGLRLLKAPGFTAPNDTDGVFDTPNYIFCLNREGQVTSYNH